MYAQIVDVSPDIATAWMSKNHRNRTISRTRVERYADDMKRGNWDCTSQGIAFDVDGNLVDGQHRLSAVIMSNTTVKMFVVFDAPRSANIDQGMTRRTGSNLYMAGYAEKGSIYMCKHLISTANYLICVGRGAASNSVSTMETKRFMDKYKEEFEFAKNKLTVSGNGAVKGIRSAAVISAAVCATIGGYDRDKIAKWYNILATGEYEGPVEKSVLLLRNYLLRSGSLGATSDKRIAMCKSMSSLRHFIEGNAITKLYGEECFKIPDFD